MTDILTMVGAGGGISDVTSQSSELVVATSGTTRQLTLNLSAYATNSAVSSLLAGYVLASAMSSYNGADKLRDEHGPHECAQRLHGHDLPNRPAGLEAGRLDSRSRNIHVRRHHQQLHTSVE